MTTPAGQSALPNISSLRAGARATEVPAPTMRWKSRVLVPAVIFMAVVTLLGYAARGFIIPAIDVRVVPVVARPMGADTSETESSAEAPMAARSRGVLAQAPGWVEPDPYPISVPSLVEGVVREVLVLEGHRVEAGQVVARLVDEEFALAVRSAQAVVAERDSDIVRARAAASSAAAAVAVEQAVAEELRDEVERKRPLVGAGGVSAGEFHRLEIRLGGLQAKVAQARSAVTEAEAAIQQAEAALESAKAMLADAALRLSRAEIRSPSSGVVMVRLIEPGSRLSMSAREGGMAGSVVRLYDPAKLQVRVDVPLADAAKVGVGTAAELTTEALPDETFTGTVTRAVHEANIQRNTVQFKVAIDKPSAQFKPEMLMRVRFLGQPPSGAGTLARTPGGDSGLLLVLPTSVLLDRAVNSASVWLVRPGDRLRGTTVERRTISLGSQDPEEVIVTAGLQPGDRVVAGAPATLRSGDRVRVIGESITENQAGE